MHPIIQKIQAEQLKEVKINFESFRPGDTVIVGCNIGKAGESKVQDFQGVCIAKRRRGICSSFTVRKISKDEIGVEKTFLIGSDAVSYVKRVTEGKVRRVKLYYLRDRKGKAARIKRKNSFASSSQSK